jgi:hypothetical protein
VKKVPSRRPSASLHPSPLPPKFKVDSEMANAFCMDGTFFTRPEHPGTPTLKSGEGGRTQATIGRNVRDGTFFHSNRTPLSTIFCERCLRISFSSLPVDTGGREGVGYNETSSARCPFCLTRTGPLINTMFCKRCQRDRKRCRHSHMRVSGFSTCAFHTKLGSHLVTLIVQLVAFRMRRAVHSPNHHVFSLALSSRRIVVRIVCRVFVCTGGLPHVSRRPQLQPSCVPPCSLIAPRCRSSFLPRFPCTRWRARR